MSLTFDLASVDVNRFTATIEQRKMRDGSERCRAEWHCQRGDENLRVQTWSLDQVVSLARCRPHNSRRIVRLWGTKRTTGLPTASPLLDVVHAPDDDCRSALHCDHTSCRCHSPTRAAAASAAGIAFISIWPSLSAHREAWVMPHVRLRRPGLLSYLKSS